MGAPHVPFERPVRILTSLARSAWQPNAPQPHQWRSLWTAPASPTLPCIGIARGLPVAATCDSGGEAQRDQPWIFEFFPAPREPGATDDPHQSADYFNWYLDLWPRAEPLGYEGIFFSEHHFGLAYSPCPNLLIAQVAVRTRTIRLGVMGVVLPYHQPWKVVEEIGMLDHLTQGRLEIGTAAGIPQEMAQVGLSVAEARERNDEAIEIMDAALAAPVISHHGKYWRFTNLRLGAAPVAAPASADMGHRHQRGLRPQGRAPRCEGSAPAFIRPSESKAFSMRIAMRQRASAPGSFRIIWRCGARFRSAPTMRRPAPPHASASK